MRKTIFQSKTKDSVFKLHNFISEVYRKEYKKSAPDMFVGIQTVAVKGSPDNWILTAEGDRQELDKVEKIANMVDVEKLN